MRDLEEVVFYEERLDAIVHPYSRGTSVKPSNNIIGETLTAVANVMELYKQEACIEKKHLSWMTYHAKEPTAVIIPNDPVTKGSYEAAKRAIAIHTDRLKRKRYER